jgi:hypothetical protein
LTIIVAGFLSCLLGVALPFLMVLRLIEATFTLVFLAYIASVGGIMLGLIGMAWYARGQRE